MTNSLLNYLIRKYLKYRFFIDSRVENGKTEYWIINSIFFKSKNK